MPLTVAASAEDADAKKVQAVLNTLQTSPLIAEDVWGLQEDHYLRPQCVLYMDYASAWDCIEKVPSALRPL